MMSRQLLRWMRSPRRFRQDAESAQKHSESTNQLCLHFPRFIEDRAPDSFRLAWTVVEETIARCQNADLAPLARRSPGLMGFDWSHYLRCSVVRMVEVLRVLRETCPPKGQILDFGSYFGNFALMCLRAGYQVDLLDSYLAYYGALESFVDAARANGGRVFDFAEVGGDLEELTAGSYDAVLCLGVVEHLPHTPREVLRNINKLLKPRGVLILDTPNLAYLPKRQRLSRGESIYPAIQSQYFTEIPFEGHHREYTANEIKWILEQLGHEEINIQMMHFSIYMNDVLSGEALDNYQLMETDPSMRELIFAWSRKSDR